MVVGIALPLFFGGTFLERHYLKETQEQKKQTLDGRPLRCCVFCSSSLSLSLFAPCGKKRKRRRRRRSFCLSFEKPKKKKTKTKTKKEGHVYDGSQKNGEKKMGLFRGLRLVCDAVKTHSGVA